MLWREWLLFFLWLSGSPAGAKRRPAHGRRDISLSAAKARALSKGVTDHVIIVLKDEPPAGPVTGPAAAVRSRPIASAQAPILSELHQTSAAKVHTYSLVDAVSATVSAGEASRLARNPSVKEVIPDVLGPGARRARRPSSTPAGKTPPAPTTPLPIPPGACPAQGQPALLGDELSLIHAASNSPVGTDGPLARLHRRRGEGRLHGRGDRHRQSRFHPAERQPCLRRLPGLQW